MLVQHKIMALAIDINRYKSIIRTEEATKTACIEPFFRLLGWDFSNPLQVIPEFTADFGVKAGERVDYCMKDEDTVCLIVECKSIDVKLSEKHISQLYRYFSVTDPHYAVLTNGVDYQIFTDSIKQNIMDSKPIFEFSIFDLENISFEMLVTFLSNPHFVDGMDESDCEECGSAVSDKAVACTKCGNPISHGKQTIIESPFTGQEDIGYKRECGAMQAQYDRAKLLFSGYVIIFNSVLVFLHIVFFAIFNTDVNRELSVCAIINIVVTIMMTLSCVKKHPLLCLLGNIVLNIFVIVLVMLISV